MPDIAASVLARLKNKAKATGISYQQCLQLFFQEEFLRRLAGSKYADNDKTAIATTRSELVRRMDTVRYATDDKPIIDMWGKFTTGQTADKIRYDVVSGQGTITPIAFRPFDNRWTYYSGNSCSWVFRPREKSTMGHLLADPTSPIGANIGLVFCKTYSDRLLQRRSFS